MKKDLNELETKMEELQKENDKLIQTMNQESDAKEKIMIESKADKQAFASMKNFYEEITLALE
jgi:hypothetical protein